MQVPAPLTSPQLQPVPQREQNLPPSHHPVPSTLRLCAWIAECETAGWGVAAFPGPAQGALDTKGVRVAREIQE